MSEPIKQHYIPRSYLRNFAESGKKNNWYVDIYLKKEKKIQSNVNTKTICYQENLYTLENNDVKNKYKLELYYANNVDKEFQNVYNLLIDKRINVLTKEEKMKILYVCLSFYFRTPIYLNNINSSVDNIFNRLKKYADSNNIIKTTMFGGTEISTSELENIRKKAISDNKTKFHEDHLEKWFGFIHFKYECTINVIEIIDENSYLITSDNPVTIRELFSNEFKGLFNPENVITLPLDLKHYLEIHPNTVADDNYSIRRFKHPKEFALTINSTTEQNAMQILIGKKGTLESHFKLQNEYEQQDLRDEAINNIKTKNEFLNEFLKIASEHGIKSKEAINQLKEINSNHLFKDDKQIEEYIMMYKKLNLW